MASFGTLTVHLALLASALAAPLFLRAGSQGGRGLAAARALAAAAAALLTAALALLGLAAVAHDFRIEYVAAYTDRTTDLEYLATAVWAGQAGSLLVWETLLAWVPVLLGGRLRRSAPALEPLALGALALLSCCLLVIVVGWSNPFVVFEGAGPIDGEGLNPLLRNILMVLHPPALLAGYVAYAAPAAITVAALVRGSLDRTWLAELRRWSLVAWVLLTVGNVLGMAWAYGELGWGGYWGWDPVENAALIPWIVGTALLHATIGEERASAMKGWAAPLSLLTFWLTLLGTWLTRSGVVASVHAFGGSAVGTAFGVLLALLGLALVGLLVARRELLGRGARPRLFPVVFVALGLAGLAFARQLLGGPAVWAAPLGLAVAVAAFAARPSLRASFPLALASFVVASAGAGALEPAFWPSSGAGLAGLVALGLVTGALRREDVTTLLSRRGLLTAATGLLLALAGGVLLGTLLPLLSQLAVGQPAQVGPEWYDDWAAPAGLVLLALTGLCAGLGGRKVTLRGAAARLAGPVAAGLAALGAALALGSRDPLAVGAAGLAAATGLAALLEAGRTLVAARRRSDEAEEGAARSASRLGAALAHAGLAVLFLGVSGEAAKTERDLALGRGEAARVASATVRLEDVHRRFELDREVVEAEVVVERPGRRPETLRPARHVYRSHPDQPTSEAAWLTDSRGDLFLALGRVDVPRGQAGLRAVATPLLPWVWVGATLLGLGGLLAVVLLLRPSRRALLGSAGAAALTALLWWLVRPSTAFAALAALSVGLAILWLGLALVRPLWKLEPGAAAKVSRPTCPSCGSALVHGSLYCHKCGARAGDHD